MNLFMLSLMVPMSSVAFMSVTIVLSVVVSVFGPQADTARAAPAISLAGKPSLWPLMAANMVSASCPAALATDTTH